MNEDKERIVLTIDMDDIEGVIERGVTDERMRSCHMA